MNENQLLREALKTSEFDLICQAIDKADTITMEGDYMLDSDDCIAVVRTMQVLLDITRPARAALSHPAQSEGGEASPDALAKLRTALLSNAELLPKVIFPCGDEPHQTWSFSLHISTPKGTETYSPTLSAEQCLDKFIDEPLHTTSPASQEQADEVLRAKVAHAFDNVAHNIMAAQSLALQDRLLKASQEQAQQPADCDGGTCGLGGYCNECPRAQSQELPDERAAFEAEMHKKHGWNNSYFTRSLDDGYLSNRATYAHIGWQARAALAEKQQRNP